MRNGGGLSGDTHRIGLCPQLAAGNSDRNAMDTRAGDTHPGLVSRHVTSAFDGGHSDSVGRDYLWNGILKEQGISPLVLNAQRQYEIFVDEPVCRSESEQSRWSTSYNGESSHRR